MRLSGVLLFFVLLFVISTSGIANPVGGRDLPDGLTVDSIVIDKAAHEMRVFNHNQLLKKYRVCLGLKPIGKKQVAGDFKTPEGLYHINNKNPQSQFHKSLGISYPNKEDILVARKLHHSPGGDIMIHGLPNGQENVGPHRYRNDWTWGCIALRNNEIDDLFEHVKVGIPVLIRP